MHFENEETQEVEAVENTEQQQEEQVNPREVLFQVFEQGARACQNWEVSQARINCLISLQTKENLAEVSQEEKTEILGVLNNLLQSGQLNFGIQQVLYPMVKELER